MGSKRLHAYPSRHWVLAGVLMGVSFVLFGLLTLNLLQTINANLGFLSAHGMDAVREGGLLQLRELLLTGYLAVGCYVAFKPSSSARRFWSSGSLSSRKRRSICEDRRAAG